MPFPPAKVVIASGAANYTSRVMRKLYSILAVLLPVALGLGLQYLYIMGRLSGSVVFAAIVVMILVIVGVPLLVRAVRDDRLDADRYDSPTL